MTKNVLFLFLSIIISNSCRDNNDSFNNPYDSNTPPDIWAPQNLSIIQLDTIIELSWEQEIQNIDGFKIDRQKDLEAWQIGIGKVDKLTKKWYDKSFLANPRFVYKYRVYAFAGTNVSTSISVELRPTEFKKTFKDFRDDKIYDYVTLGNQVWMAENLNFETSSGSWCYDDNIDNGSRYGRLYDFYTAISACPVGWHLPSDIEWKTLESYLGMSSSDLDSMGALVTRSSGKVGLKLIPYSPAFDNDACGFDAQFGGLRHPDGSYSNIDWHAYYWSSDQIYRQLIGHNEWVFRDKIVYTYGLSVRCVKN